MKAIIYRRCSREEEQDGLGLAAQLDACMRYAHEIQCDEVLDFADEGYSGALSVSNRPALTSALAAAGKGDVFIVSKRDRLGRDMLVTLTIEQLLKKKGVRLVSVAGEGTDSGDEITALILRTISDLFAQVERETISLRTRNALAIKRARGERVGSVPYGFRLDEDGQSLLIDPKEEVAVNRIVRLRNDGHTYRSIGAELKKENLLPRRASNWHPVQIRRIYERARIETQLTLERLGIERPTNKDALQEKRPLF
ncbi:MAG TPA: recombinase family protein [Blastocatellia bacterium]|nr:recombinase family protein [Blastocatellia bacterium]